MVRYPSTTRVYEYTDFQRSDRAHQHPAFKDAMTSSNDPLPLTFYPAYCFSQSPTFHTWVKLTAADVHALKAREGFEGQKIYFHLNHPIKWIRLVGVVVALDEYEKRWIATVDDGSGATVEIACAKAVGKLAGEESVNGNGAGDGDGNAIGKGDGETTTITITSTGQAIDLRAIEVGSVIKAKGGIGEFRGVRQMLLERIGASSLHPLHPLSLSLPFPSLLLYPRTHSPHSPRIKVISTAHL